MLKLLELAAQIAIGRRDRRVFYLGAVGVRHDQTIISARNEASLAIVPSGHAEARLVKKLDYYATVYVARVRCVNTATPELAIAKPCPNCMRLLINKKVKKVFWTTGPGTFDSMELI